jgi:hypothetical protein
MTKPVRHPNFYEKADCETLNTPIRQQLTMTVSIKYTGILLVVRVCVKKENREGKRENHKPASLRGEILAPRYFASLKYLQCDREAYLRSSY